MGSESLVKRMEKLAEEERAKILREAEVRIEKIRSEAEEELKAFREAQERLYRKESERLRNLILSSAKRKVRETLAAAKEELIWQVISRTTEYLRQFRGEEYLRWMFGVIERGESFLGEDSLIFPVREEDLPELRKRYGERVRDNLITGSGEGLNPRVVRLLEEFRGTDLLGGVVMIAPDGSVIGDYTLAGKLKRGEEGIRERISKELFGEEVF